MREQDKKKKVNEWKAEHKEERKERKVKKWKKRRMNRLRGREKSRVVLGMRRMKRKRVEELSKAKGASGRKKGKNKT